MKEGSNRLWINSFRLLNSVWYKKTKCVEDWEGYRDCIWGGWLGLVDFPSFSIKKRLLLSVHHVPKVHVVGIHSMLTSARHLFPVLAFWPRFFLLHSTDVFLHPLCLPQLLLRDHLTTDSVVWHTASYADPTVESEQTGSSLSAAEKCNTSYCTVSPPAAAAILPRFEEFLKCLHLKKEPCLHRVLVFISESTVADDSLPTRTKTDTLLKHR